jgi:hypothetical protein
MENEDRFFQKKRFTAHKQQAIIPSPLPCLFFVLVSFFALLTFSSCSKLGYGVLLWSTEEPPIPSGTVLPVYIRSNIDRVWVVGVPKPYIKDEEITKIEIPLSQFEFSGSRSKAEKRAEEFSQYALIYAENLQDGLPIRDNPDNNSRRVYRLRTGEIIKIIDIASGNPPIGTTGDPLDGNWYKVLTQNGVTGFCFSYRLKIFDYREGSFQAVNITQKETAPDTELDMVMSKAWSPELYLQMVDSKRINIEALGKHWRFDPGQDTGIARIILPELEREFVYEGIYPDGERAWRFEGTTLQMNLRTNNTLAVQFTEGQALTGSRRTFVFTALTSDVDDLIIQENARRESQFLNIYNEGPVFTSNNYGTIVFSPTGGFTWTGFDLLVPQLIPAETNGEGQVYMNLFLAASFEERYDGAFALQFLDSPETKSARFMYKLDNQGMRLEVVQDFAVENQTVTRRSSSPMVLYFFRDYSP